MPLKIGANISPSFKNLEHLDLSNYPPSPGDMEDVKFDDVIENTIANMKSLKSLDLSGCQLIQVS